MPAPVRTRRLFGPTAFAAVLVVAYTVPADRTAIIRSMTVSSTSAVNSSFVVNINGVHWWSGAVSAGNSVALPYCALDDDETVSAISAGALGTFTIAGFGSLLVGDPS